VVRPRSHAPRLRGCWLVYGHFDAARWSARQLAPLDANTSRFDSGVHARAGPLEPGRIRPTNIRGGARNTAAENDKIDPVEFAHLRAHSAGQRRQKISDRQRGARVSTLRDAPKPRSYFFFWGVGGLRPESREREATVALSSRFALRRGHELRSMTVEQRARIEVPRARAQMTRPSKWRE